MHGGPVDDQRPAAQLLRQRDRLRHHSVVGAASELSNHLDRSGPDGVHPEVRPGSKRRPLGDRGERSGHAERVRGGVQHHGRDVEQHAVQHRGRSSTATPESPTWIHSEVTPFSRSVSAASCDACASGSASTRGRPSRRRAQAGAPGRQVRHRAACRAG